MKTTTNLKTLIGAAALLLVAITAVTPAKADWDDHRWDRHDDWRAHERASYDWRAHHPYYVPGYVSAPPAVVYAPPPPSGLSLFFPIHFN